MSHENIRSVLMAGKEHLYAIEVNGRLLGAFDKDGNGTIEEVVPLEPKSPKGPADRAKDFAKYVPIAQAMAAKFRANLPKELMALKGSMKHIQPKLFHYPSLCPTSKGVTPQAVFLSHRQSHVFDLNSDQRVDMVMFTTSDGVEVNISAAENTAPSTAQCKSFDALRQGVGEYLQLLDDLPLMVP